VRNPSMECADYSASVNAGGRKVRRKFRRGLRATVSVYRLAGDGCGAHQPRSWPAVTAGADGVMATALWKRANHRTLHVSTFADA